MLKYANARTRTHPNQVVTFGATEPILTALDVGGFPIRDLFLIGINDLCGSIIVDSEQRAREAAAALQPGYEVKVSPFGPDWAAKYSLRDRDGQAPERLVTPAP